MQNYYRVNDVAKTFSVSRSTIWRWVRKGNFPNPTKLGSRTTVWSQKSLQEFIDSKIIIDKNAGMS